MQKAVGFSHRNVQANSLRNYTNSHRVKIDIRSEEIREQEQLDKMYRTMSLIGQAIVALTISLTMLTAGFQTGRWMGWW